MPENQDNTFAIKFSDSLMKAVCGTVCLFSSIGYLVFFLQLEAHKEFHNYLAIFSVIVILACVTWAVGREAIMTAVHVVKEVFGCFKKKKPKKAKNGTP